MMILEFLTDISKGHIHKKMTLSGESFSMFSIRGSDIEEFFAVKRESDLGELILRTQTEYQEFEEEGAAYLLVEPGSVKAMAGIVQT